MCVLSPKKVGYLHAGLKEIKNHVQEQLSQHSKKAKDLIQRRGKLNQGKGQGVNLGSDGEGLRGQNRQNQNQQGRGGQRGRGRGAREARMARMQKVARKYNVEKMAREIKGVSMTAFLVTSEKESQLKIASNYFLGTN